MINPTKKMGEKEQQIENVEDSQITKTTSAQPKFWSRARIEVLAGVVFAILFVIVLIITVVAVVDNNWKVYNKSQKDNANRSSSKASYSTSGYRLTEYPSGLKMHYLVLESLAVTKTFFNFLRNEVWQKSINSSDEYPVLKSFFSYVTKLNPYVAAKPEGKVNLDDFIRVVKDSLKGKKLESGWENDLRVVRIHILELMLKESKQLAWPDLTSVMKTLRGLITSHKENEEDAGFLFDKVRKESDRRDAAFRWTIDPRAKILRVQGNYRYDVGLGSGQNAKYKLSDLTDSMVVNEEAFNKSPLPFTEKDRTYRLSSITLHKTCACAVLIRTEGTARDEPNAWVYVNHTTDSLKFMSEAQTEELLKKENWGIFTYYLERSA